MFKPPTRCSGTIRSHQRPKVWPVAWQSAAEGVERISCTTRDFMDLWGRIWTDVHEVYEVRTFLTGS